MSNDDAETLGRELEMRWPGKFLPSDVAFWVKSLGYSFETVMKAITDWRNRNPGKPTVDEIRAVCSRYAAQSMPAYRSPVDPNLRTQYQIDDALIDTMNDEVLAQWKEHTIRALPESKTVNDSVRKLYRKMDARRCRSLKLEICAAYRIQQEQEQAATA